jgi:uncharacterized membrane protein YphA (DoxX/SURF4 family)
LLAAATLPDLARVALGIALVVAAVAKVVAAATWVDQAADVGVPRPIAVGLPWLELTVGAAVVAGVAEPWPAAIAVALLAVFTGWIVVHLARGQHPPCACFGAASTAPLSWWHAARNGVLMVLGLVALIP